jgi:hypothetical protein
MTDDRLTSDELFAIFNGLIPTPVAFYLMNGGAKLDRGALEMVQAVREQATNDRIEAQAAEIERLRKAGTKLSGYAGHDDDCEIMLKGVWGDKTPCDCGYEDAWKALRDALGEAE